MKKEFNQGFVALSAFALSGAIGGILGGSVLGDLVKERHSDSKQKNEIVFEKDGTAVVGRESGLGWLGLSCDESGKVTVRVVNSKWGVEQKGSFQSGGCDDGELSPGEINIEDIPSDLRG